MSARDPSPGPGRPERTAVGPAFSGSGTSTATDPGVGVEIEVQGDGDPILLVMGLGMPGSMWTPIVPALAARHRVATFDHRGVGRSPGPARDSMRGLVEDATAVLDHLGWASAHVVGVSMGGMIAQELALTAPGRVRTLTLIATHAGGPLALFPPLLGALAFLGAPSRRLERLLHPPAFREAMRERAATARSALAPRPTVRAHLRAVRGHDTRARLSALKVPTLVVKPGRDVLIRPSHADRLAAAIPGARLEVRPEAGHGLIAHDAEILAELVLAHVGR